MMNLQPVEGHKHLFRDRETGAILNVNTEVSLGIKHSKQNRQRAKEQLETNTNDINSIKTELTEIKTMLRILVDGR